MRWEEPGEQNYSFPVNLTTTHYGYAFVRVRTTNDNLREANIGTLMGPIALRNGTSWEVPISDDILKESAELTARVRDAYI